MTKFSAFIGVWVALLGVGAIVMVGSSMPSASEKAQPTEQVKLPDKNEAPEHIQGACMSKVRGLIPNGTKVKGMSVAYRDTFESPSRLVYNFYNVTVAAEIDGRRFSSTYLCRQVGNAIEIMRG